MKKIVPVFMIAIMAIGNLSAQQTETKAPLTKADYLKKSKSQKIAGFILLGVGATCIAIAAPGDVTFDILPTLVIGGGSCILASIPLFLASSKNKRKAAKMTAAIEMENVPMLQHWTIGRSAYPALSVRIHF